MSKTESGDTVSLMRVSTVLAKPIVSNLSKSTVRLPQAVETLPGKDMLILTFERNMSSK